MNQRALFFTFAVKTVRVLVSSVQPMAVIKKQKKETVSEVNE
nr:hypothetical protein [uncultured Desulfobacter sp.]